MIICFTPGSGGNRLGLYYQNKPFDQIGGNMHTFAKIIDQYCTKESKITVQYDINAIHLTHCMNNQLIKALFPNQKIVKIKCDFKKSLLREWMTVYENTDYSLTKLDLMYQQIVWHHEYYEQNGLDYDCDELVDIETDSTRFGEIMRRELNLSNKTFDIAWQAFKDYGNKAPIINIGKRSNGT